MYNSAVILPAYMSPPTASEWQVGQSKEPCCLSCGYFPLVTFRSRWKCGVMKSAGGVLAVRWMSGSTDQSRHILDLYGTGYNDNSYRRSLWFHPFITMTNRAVWGQHTSPWLLIYCCCPYVKALWSSRAWRHGSSSGNIAIKRNDPTIPKDTYSCLRSLRGRAIAEERKKMVENYIYSFSKSAQDWMGDCSDFPKLHKFI